MYLYHLSDNAETMAKHGAQAVVWQTAINPVIALELLAAGVWQGVGRARPGGLRSGALPRPPPRPGRALAHRRTPESSRAEGCCRRRNADREGMTALDTPAPAAALRGEKRPIVYCRRCLIPETKPDIFFDADGVCSACRHFEHRGDVDWDARRRELDHVLDRYRSPDGTTYDCIIGVSGGKDSTTQTIRMLELGMNPLCVTATTDELSDIGRRNIENLKSLGVDFVEYTTNQVVRRRVNKLALCQVG